MIPVHTAAALGHLIPDGWSRVIYGVVKTDHQVFDLTIEDYRRPYAGELGMPQRQFLSVIRKSK